MKQERLKILSLLEEGKITAEEAAKLLEAIRKPESESGMHFSFDETAEGMEDRLNRFAKGLDGFTREFGSRVESAYKDVEPKLKKASQTVLERTAAIFDEISKSLHESLDNARANAGDCCGDACCDGDDECDDTCCEEIRCDGDDAPKEN